MSPNDKRGKPGSDPLGDLRLGFNGLLGALGEALSEISERLEDGEAGEVRRSFEVDTGRGPLRAEAGVRVRFADPGRTAPLGAERVMTRPVKDAAAPARTPAGAAAERPPRPIDFEIVEDAGTWRLTADIPGVEEGELSLGLADGELAIETTGARRYSGRAALPAGATPKDIGVSLRNGILELSFGPGKAAGR